MSTLVWCAHCYRFVPAHGRPGGEIVDRHEIRRGIECRGSTLTWPELEVRAWKEGPSSVTGAT